MPGYFNCQWAREKDEMLLSKHEKLKPKKISKDKLICSWSTDDCWILLES